MKTNNIIDISNESLQDAKDRINTYSINEMQRSRPVFNEGFDAGAKWQKEKDKAIQDKLIHRLERLTTALERQINESGNKSKLSIMAVQEYNRSIQLLNQLNESK